MLNAKGILAVVAVIGVTWIALLSGGESQMDFEVSGEVLDKENKPITAVLVQVERGAEVREARSDRNGKYVVTFKAGSPLTTVKYEHTDWNPGTVADLSGERSHKINKTMYRRGSQLAALEAQDVLSALERIYYTETLVKRTPVEKFGPLYTPFVKEMTVPKELVNRHDEVRRLYRMG